jgi:hypothetical protein
MTFLLFIAFLGDASRFVLVFCIFRIFHPMKGSLCSLLACLSPGLQQHSLRLFCTFLARCTVLLLSFKPLIPSFMQIHYGICTSWCSLSFVSNIQKLLIVFQKVTQKISNLQQSFGHSRVCVAIYLSLHCSFSIRVCCFQCLVLQKQIMAATLGLLAPCNNKSRLHNDDRPSWCLWHPTWDTGTAATSLARAADTTMTLTSHLGVQVLALQQEIEASQLLEPPLAMIITPATQGLQPLSG